MAQKFVNDDGQPYDPMRTLRLGSFGFFVHGTTGHYFYGFLDSKLPGTKPTTVATKVLIDQTMWNPIFGLMFFGYLNVCEGKSFDDYKKKIQADLVSLHLSNKAQNKNENEPFCSRNRKQPSWEVGPFGCRRILSTLLSFRRRRDCCTSTRFRLGTISFCLSWEIRRLKEKTRSCNGCLDCRIRDVRLRIFEVPF